LSNTDNASVSLRKLLLESCNLHTVLDCPGGTFQGAGVKTVVLFFEKGAPTRKVWFYQLDVGRNMGKTNPLNDADLGPFIEAQNTFADTAQSWSVDVAAVNASTFDLSVKNPNVGVGGCAPQPAGHHGRDRRAGCGGRRSAGVDSGVAVIAIEFIAFCARSARNRGRFGLFLPQQSQELTSFGARS
jgi:type I restriction-modification system DNA methylase subunit